MSQEKVNNDYIDKEVNSQNEGASFFDDYYRKSTPKINPDEVVSGMWEDADNMIKIKYYNILTMVVASTAAT